MSIPRAMPVWGVLALHHRDAATGENVVASPEIGDFVERGAGGKAFVGGEHSRDDGGGQAVEVERAAGLAG